MEPVKYKSFKWNEHGVCTNPKESVVWKAPGEWPCLRPYFRVLTAECESGWSFSTDYEMMFAGGGCYPRYGGIMPGEKECIVAGLQQLVTRIKDAMDYTNAQSDKEEARAMLRRVNEQLAECMQYELF